ncbi:MAG: hypothetical protein LBJ92_02415 [Holosporales bacterium]|nr:hypothetical protein [Holosporales bacterium]
MKCNCSALLLLLFLINLNLGVPRIVSGLCTPYYASIKKGNTGAYRGPGKQYKVVCLYTNRGVPVIITAKYDHWRRIKDPDGAECWVHKNYLSPKRSVMVIEKEGTALFSAPKRDEHPIAHIKKNVIMSLLSVQDEWCKVEVKHNGDVYTGWIKAKHLFGAINE